MDIKLITRVYYEILSCISTHNLFPQIILKTFIIHLIVSLEILIGVGGEIRPALFVIVRSRPLHAQIGRACFAVCRHFSLLVVCVATRVATFFNFK